MKSKTARALRELSLGEVGTTLQHQSPGIVVSKSSSRDVPISYPLCKVVLRAVYECFLSSNSSKVAVRLFRRRGLRELDFELSQNLCEENLSES